MGYTAPSDGTPCTACGVGTYKPTTGAQTCSLCPIGTSSRKGSIQITDCTCRPGYRAYADGEQCIPCEPGTYKDEPGSGIIPPPPPEIALTTNICGPYAIHARVSVTFGAGDIIDRGDVGVSPGFSVTGIPVFNNGGTIVYDSAIFAASVLVSHANMMETREDEQIIPVGIAGLTFTPGTHRSVGAINIAAGGIVTLDGLQETNPAFIFQCGTFNVGASASVVLINGAKPEHILWVVGAASVIGASAVVQGSILGGTTIGFAATTQLQGCALAQTTITFGATCSVELPEIIIVEPPDPELPLCTVCPNGTTSLIGRTSIDCVTPDSISTATFSTALGMQLIEFNSERRFVFVHDLAIALNVSTGNIVTTSVIGHSNRRRRLLTESIEVETVVTILSLEEDILTEAASFDNLNTSLSDTGFPIDGVSVPFVVQVKPITTRPLTDVEQSLIIGLYSCPCVNNTVK